MFFRESIGEFGQRLGFADPHPHRNPDPAFDFSAKVGGHLLGIEMPKALPFQEGLIDGVDFLTIRVLSDHRHHASGKISVEGVVRGKRYAASRFEALPNLEIGGPHLDAHGFGLIGACDTASIVIGEDNDRTMPQGGAEQPLATDIEIIAVNQDEPALRRHE